MKQLILGLIMLCCGQGFCQSRSMFIKNLKEKDSYAWYESTVTLGKELNLTSIADSPYSRHFRIWLGTQALEIWQSETGAYSGLLAHWVKEHVPDEEAPTNRLHFLKTDLDSLTARRIANLIDSGKVENIPDEDALESWKQGFDGITYIIERATRNDYYFKSYWTPTAQKGLQEAVVLQHFVDKALTLVDAPGQWKTFASTIPFECYSSSGHSITCKVLTKKDKKKYTQERDNYRQHHPSR